MTALMSHPPCPGEPSYPLYSEEKEGILASLHRRATKLVAALNLMEGVTCNEADGSLYVFPQIHLPPKAYEAAAAEHRPPDAFYCLAMLNRTGIVVVPGSGFGQVDGTLHFRSTILPSEEAMDGVIQKMADFHRKFLVEYA